MSKKIRIVIKYDRLLYVIYKTTTEEKETKEFTRISQYNKQVKTINEHLSRDHSYGLYGNCD
tara:strand:- start:2502 stop:2687 length:186 start_codon:yes stop_codon:yes gene_type:complete